MDALSGTNNSIMQIGVSARKLQGIDRVRTRKTKARIEAAWKAVSTDGDLLRVKRAMGIGRNVLPGRNQSAATMTLVIALGGILVLIVLAFFWLGLSFGGSEETRNAVDAGALNVGKEAFNITVPIGAGNEAQFEDVADSKGKFGLTNINRVYAKSLLVNLNVKAMKSNLQGTPESDANGDAIYRSAESIGSRLSAELNKAANLYKSFDSISRENNVQMLGSKATVKNLPDKDWKTSCVDRGAESNISVLPQVLPDPAELKNLGTKKVSGTELLPGYQGVEQREHSFHFVPYKTAEKPHLISLGFFQSNSIDKSPVPGWKDPVPNSFSVHGQTSQQNGGAKHDVLSCVQVNPQRSFKLSIPHGFIRIKLDRNRVSFRVNGSPHPEADGDYPPVPPSSRSDSFPDGVGVGTVFVFTTLGLEYVPANLFRAIYALPGDHTKVAQALLQRCAEFKPDCTEAELNKALTECRLTPGQSEYLIFPVGDDKKGKVMIVATSAPDANAQAAWIKKDARADGKELVFATEFIGPIPQPAPAPNQATVTVVGPGVPVFLPSFVTELGEEYWRPGSGFDGCLGQLRIRRETMVDANGFVEPII